MLMERCYCELNFTLCFDYAVLYEQWSHTSVCFSMI